MINHKVYVAVVEDDESFGKALARMLRAAGFEASLFPSAESFLAPQPAPTPDCLVLDIQLSGMSGLELRRLLHTQGWTVPVIFITAMDEPAIRDEAWRIGCANYFRKPVPGRLLVQAITDAVQAAGS
jgi:FixJ family two-component response regulator